MGYIPAHHNEIATQYGSRVQATSSRMQPTLPVQPIQRFQVYRRYKGAHDTDIERNLYRQRMERQLTGKGRRYDQLG